MKFVYLLVTLLRCKNAGIYSDIDGRIQNKFALNILELGIVSNVDCWAANLIDIIRKNELVESIKLDRI